MRIHGKVKIKRRTDIEQKSTHDKYLEDLRIDFHYICGYCGKTEELTSKGFEIEHITPLNIDPDREVDYTNLAYCCFTCNRKKLGKWPTNDKNIMHDGVVGIVDPATDEYDVHLSRNSSGEIVGLTPLGTYICKEIFKFDQRPMEEIWKFMQLIEKKKLLREKPEKLNKDKLIEYIKLDEQIDELYKIFFNKRE